MEDYEPQEAPIGPISQPLRRYYGEERRRLFAGDYDGIERRIPDPPTEQDWYCEPGPN